MCRIALGLIIKHNTERQADMTATQFMAGKRGLVMGVANDRSIAWGISKQLAEQGAELAFTYQGEALEKRVKPLAESVGSDILLPCDVTDEASIDQVFTTIEEKWGKLDFVIHAIAFSDKNELDGLYLDTTRENFRRTMDISVYSFTAVAQRAAPLLNEGGSLLTLTYYGSERVMPHYNVMGVAKAALEACVRYLAADLGAENERNNFIAFVKKLNVKIDVLVNNAGLMPLSFMNKLKVDEWDRMVDVNIKGVLYGIAAVLPHMEERKEGHIINISSIDGIAPTPGSEVYAAAKSAIEGLCQSLAQEVAPFGVHVTNVEPGP